MCGAGVLPARMAAEARRQGWRVVAFTFGDAVGLAPHVDVTIPSRFTELAPVIAALGAERVSAALFSGKFWLGDVLHATGGDATARGIADRAGSLAGSGLANAVVATLGNLGVDVLDQRRFVGDWLDGDGCWTTRQPNDDEWADVRHGLEIARLSATHGVGQTVTIKRGVIAAVEAIEGTTAAIQRGAQLAGRGAVVVKAVAPSNDYRFDTPTIGLETLEAAAAGGVAVLAVEANRVLLLERETLLKRADEFGMALVGVGGDDAIAR
jgi:DUF1009 family protein